ncbi:hypothetical protein D7Z54_02145 [Salibacterium salarium]|uniref:Uncharacterized protein n=1 Tax=Salibacterium salarium TaxID=284579 RepID=A0A428NAG7_9BACI|nr:hypothetical protein [Salibacterium salarium]RSL35387.1 hypothetical protein D7Z54_02145 [Salibacterium salarium]
MRRRARLDLALFLLVEGEARTSIPLLWLKRGEWKGERTFIPLMVGEKVRKTRFGGNNGMDVRRKVESGGKERNKGTNVRRLLFLPDPPFLNLPRKNTLKIG